MSLLIAGEPYVASLYRAIGSEAFALVAEWMRDIAAETALEWDNRIVSSSTSWLAECLTNYDPNEHPRSEAAS